MSILIYIDSENGKVKKSSYEVATYAKTLAQKQNTKIVAVTINIDNPEMLGTYGIDKVLNVADEKLQHFSAKAGSEERREYNGAFQRLVASQEYCPFISHFSTSRLCA